MKKGAKITLFIFLGFVVLSGITGVNPANSIMALTWQSMAQRKLFLPVMVG